MCYNNFPMKKLALIVIAILLTPSLVYAESSATVKINNNVNSSSNSNTSVTSKTNITVETDGEVTSYSSDKPGNIEVKSVNGKSEIKVNGEVVKGESTTSETDISKIPTATSSVSPSPTMDQEEKEKEIKNVLEKIEDLVKKLFSFF